MLASVERRVVVERFSSVSVGPDILRFVVLPELCYSEVPVFLWTWTLYAARVPVHVGPATCAGGSLTVHQGVEFSPVQRGKLPR